MKYLDLVELINDNEKKNNMFCEEKKNLEKDIERYKNSINSLNMHLKGYKEHFLVLNKQNKAMTEELGFIIERDTQLSEKCQSAGNNANLRAWTNNSPRSFFV